jgi:hypothetical protein
MAGSKGEDMKHVRFMPNKKFIGPEFYVFSFFNLEIQNLQKSTWSSRVRGNFTYHWQKFMQDSPAFVYNNLAELQRRRCQQQRSLPLRA